jgi:hypothetical protein
MGTALNRALRRRQETLEAARYLDALAIGMLGTPLAMGRARGGPGVGGERIGVRAPPVRQPTGNQRFPRTRSYGRANTARFADRHAGHPGHMTIVLVVGPRALPELTTSPDEPAGRDRET